MTLTSTATPQDVKWAALLATPEDILEFQCLFPKEDHEDHLEEFLWRATQHPEAYTMRVLRNPLGFPLLLGGWSRLSGVAWFITTTLAKKNRVTVLKAIKECREEALLDCPRLWNTVMKSNRKHVRLLEAIGAEFIGPIHCIGGEPFQAFIIDKGGDQCAG